MTLIPLPKEAIDALQGLNTMYNEEVKRGQWVTVNKHETPMQVIIKPEMVDASVLKEGAGSQEFRPTTWEQYVGQSSAKAKVQSFVNGCQKFNETFPHTFLTAPAGCGKTLFASILAHQLNKKLVITTGGELKSEQILVDKLAECDILFVDEANKLNKKVGFFMLPMMEQFKIGNKPIKPFTIIFATTHAGDLSKDLDALISRCECIDLEPYTNEEMFQIVQQYNKKQYPTETVNDDILKEIVHNCRQTPRLAKNLVRAFIYMQDWNKVKTSNNIIINGLTKTDFQVLEYLAERKNGAGKDSLAKMLRVKPQTFEWSIETYLINQGLLEVGARRKITDKGRELLIKLSKEGRKND